MKYLLLFVPCIVTFHKVGRMICFENFIFSYISIKEH